MKLLKTINGKNIYSTGKFFTEKLCLDHKELLFVFGDNLEMRGKGGQAVIRDQPNAYGVATKAKPSRTESSYFSDHITEHMDSMIRDIEWLDFILKESNYKGIVFPEAGLGTGLADLENKAPNTFKELCSRLEKYNFNNKPLN